MKNNISILNILAVATLIGCQEAPMSDNETANYFAFSAGVANTRTEIAIQGNALVFQWANHDEIGIYGTLDDKSLGDNYAYTGNPNSENASNCTFRASTYGQAYQNVAAGSEFYAYYPYNQAVTGSTPDTFPITLPAKQQQLTADSPDHLAQYGFMTAAPVRITNPSEGAVFNFQNLYSIVEFKLKIAASASLEEVPLKQIRITSATTDLAIIQGTTDLTSPERPINISEGGKSVIMTFEQEALLAKSERSFYFVVAPGNHPDGDITMEITAIDNSINTIVLSGDVIFKSNAHYTKPIELALEDFKLTDEFDVVPTTLTCNAGESIDFVFSGIAEEIAFWSGEAGHEYRYATQGKLQYSSVNMNFKSVYINGMQRKCATVRYSTDFNGEYTEESINKASWTDVSSQFQLPPYISVSSGNKIDPEANDFDDPYDSGIIDITSWFPDYDTPVYFAFFYHVDTFDANFVDEKTGLKGNGRTWFQIYSVESESCYPNETPTSLISVTGTEQNQIEVINGASYAEGKDTNICKKGVPSGGTTVIRMQAAFKPTTDRDAWAITHAIYRPAPKHAPADTGTTVKNKSDMQPERHSYIFTQPGEYTTTVVATVTTLAGELKIEKEFKILVN